MSKKSSVDQVIDRNVQALIDLRKKHDSARKPRERAMDAIAQFIGSPPFLYIHIGILGAWIYARPFPFEAFAAAASVEAIFLSTFLLINQNRLKTLEQKREDLDLQVSLLIEHELTRLGRVCDLIAARVGAGPEVKVAKGGLTEDVPATKVLERIEAVEKTNEEK